MKALVNTERKYYKYSYISFVQPVLTSEIPIGGDTFAAIGGGYNNNYAWKAFDGDSSTVAGMTTNGGKNVLTIYNPNPLNITSLYITQNTYIRTGTVSASNDNVNWTDLTTISTSVSSDYTVDLSSNANYYKYYKITMNTASYVYGGYQFWYPYEITITATEQIATESTSSDYDFYKDVNSFKSSMNVVRKYYKYIDKAFIPPVLTADNNGTFGGYWFGVLASTTYGANYAWKVFDGITSGTGSAWIASTVPTTFDIYNPEPIKITNIKVLNSYAANYGIATGYISVSNDGTNWGEPIATYSNSATAALADWDIDLSSNTNYYKYYRIGVSTKHATYYGIGELTLTAFTKDKQESTSSDYDFYEDGNVYYAVK